MMKKNYFLLPISLLLLLNACSKNDNPIEPQGETAFVTTLFEYRPAPGQFTNLASYGTEEVARTLLNGGTATLSLGAWGGYVIYGFDHLVKNYSGQADFNIMGNAFESSSEAGIVFVMHDTNGDGLPNDIWYELKGSEYATENYSKSRTVTYFRPENNSDFIRWEDTNGNEGEVSSKLFNFPEWVIGNVLTITAPHLTVSNLANNLRGYADTFLPSVIGDMDIDDAVDENGNAVQLSGIHFVKIMTGSLQEFGVLREFSTEITAIKDLHFASN